MSQESPKNEKQISETEWEQLKQEASYWAGQIRSNKNPSNSYGHILRNLIFSFLPDILEETTKEEQAMQYETAIDAINYVKRYFKLLEDFPEFAEKELKPGGGYFPELMSQLPGSKPFVDAYEAKLRKP